jgi:DNA mismatch endonuclease (patch repair protein)
MADVFTKDQRSDVMRKVKSNRNKSTELKLISLFKTYNMKGWRRNYKLFGKPDFTFLKNRTVVFVDGCFWHGHTCKRGTLPMTNVEFWKSKIDGNIDRDRHNITELEKQGWKVIVIWQCEIRKIEIQNERLAKLLLEIK